MQQSKILIVHDTDQDGNCAARITDKFYKEGTQFMDEASFSLEYINKHATTVVFVDHTPEYSDVTYLLEADKQVVIIDHHLETFDAFKDLVDQPNLTFVYDADKASCLLAWEHYFPEVKVTYAVTMIHKWDSWTHDEEQVLPFHYGMECMNMEDPLLWEAILGADSDKACVQILQIGNATGSFWLAQINEITDKTAWCQTVDGIRFAICNSQLTSSYDLMSFMKKADCTGAVWFWYDPTSKKEVVAIKILADEETGRKVTSRKETYDSSNENPWRTGNFPETYNVITGGI